MFSPTLTYFGLLLSLIYSLSTLLLLNLFVPPSGSSLRVVVTKVFLSLALSFFLLRVLIECAFASS